MVIVEKGRNHLLDPDDLTRPAADYSNDELKFIYRHFLGPDPLIEPRTFRRGEEEGDHAYVGEVNSIPTTVGGGGTHADGKVPRFREEDFRLLSTHGPVDGAEVADWPISYDDLEPYYAEAERSVGVAGEAGANPFAAVALGPLPDAAGGAHVRGGAVDARPPRARPHPYAARPAATRCPTTAGRRATTAGSAPFSDAPSTPRATPWPC